MDSGDLHPDEREAEIQPQRITQLLRQLDLQIGRNKDLADQVRALVDSDAYRMGTSVDALRRRWFPTGSRREKLALLALRSSRYLSSHGLLQSIRRGVRPPSSAADSSDSGSTPAVTGDDLGDYLRAKDARSLPFPAYSVIRKERRVNLVIDRLDLGWPVSKTTTGVALAILLAGEWDCDLRVITRNEPVIKQDFHRILELNSIPFPEKAEFIHLPYGELKAEAPVGEGDIFLAPTGQIARSLVEQVGGKHVLYLLIDDERLAYPPGLNRLRCNEMLASDQIHYLVSTRLLWDYFVQEGFRNIQEHGAWFEPAWPQSLYPAQHAGRAGKPCFALLVEPGSPQSLGEMGLAVVAEAIYAGEIDLDAWDFVFAGREIPDLRLGERPLGQVYREASWAQYSELLERTDLGLVLTASPHPAWPALDLAASGAVVVTNRTGAGLDLAGYPQNILCRELDFGDLVCGLREGARLAADAETRRANTAASGLCRDWSTALNGVLKQCSTWFADV